jgi:hypothetical protein
VAAGAVVTALERVTDGSERIALGLTIVAAVLYAIAAAVFWRAYPSSYVWSELLISYEGGFVRRGLLGELAYLLHPIVSARVLLTGLFLVVYVAVAASVIRLVCAHLNFAALLFLVSPVALTFPLNDPAAFARKDALIVATFLVALWLARRLAGWPVAAFAAMAALYAVLGLVHELGWLYFPLAVAFLLQTSGREVSPTRVRTVVAVTMAIMAVAIVLAGLFKGDARLEDEMVAAWRAAVPEAFSPRLAADYLSTGLLRNLEVMVSQTLDGVVITGYAIAALLGAVPVILYFIDRPPALSADPRRRRLTILAICAMLPTFAIAADWGRVIHLFWMHVFVFLAALPPARPDPPEPLPRPDTNLRAFLLVVTLLFLYAATWRVAHAGLRINPLLPGYVFEVQPPYRNVFGYKPVQ